jgi:hypothetical protein
MNKFLYWKHEDKNDVKGILIFSCIAPSITEADILYKEKFGKDIKTQPDVGVTIESA